MGNRAVAVLRNDMGVEGTVWFREDQAKEDAVTISGKITGLSPGKYWLHVHGCDNSTNGWESAGPHLNTDDKTHRGPIEEIRYMRSLGNIEADSNGEAGFEMTEDMLKIHGKGSVIGQSIVLYENEQDPGKSPSNAKEDSPKTGNSDGRLAYGVIVHTASEDSIEENPRIVFYSRPDPPDLPYQTGWRKIAHTRPLVHKIQLSADNEPRIVF